MRSVLVRLAALAAGIAVVASCDTRMPTSVVIPSGGSSSSSASTVKPTTTIDTPLAGALINVGDSVLVTLRLHDATALQQSTITAVTEKGNVDLGTYLQTPRYRTVTVPPTGRFRPLLRDTVVRRYIQPINPADTSVDSLRIIVITTNVAGASDTAFRRILMVAGPKVSVVTPISGDSIPAGVGLNVVARAQHPNGVGRVDIRVQGEANWPTKFDTSFTQVYTTNPRDISFSAVARLPINAPLRGRITITATAVNVDRQLGSSAPVVVYVRSANAAIPRVTQVVPPKSEFLDSVIVRATGEAITMVGLIIRDSVGTIIKRDTLRLAPPFNANVQATMSLNLPATQQGKKLGITAFAIDQAGRIGYAVPTTRGGPEGDLAAALLDSTIVVYGRTYSLPQNGVIGDVAVDAARGHVFLSNTEFNLLNVWEQSSATTKGFASTDISVGSLPWGMFTSNNPDTLLVANSGGTNISRVFIGASSAASLREDLANRILTRNTYLFTVTFVRDINTFKTKITSTGPISYSDRPQYIAQSTGGRIFYSTRPTAQAPAGTIRWLDPSLPVPDPRQIWQYGTIIKTDEVLFALFNVDSIAIIPADPTSVISDTLVVFDHPYGARTGSFQVRGVNMGDVLTKLHTLNSDAEGVFRLDVNTLGLTDTTFTAASGNRNWVAFGEGHRGGAGRVVMVADSTGPVPNFFSPVVTITDLTDNASEQVFGLALDLSGGTVASHGSQAFFSAVSDPFHLRLQGKYDSFDNGAGIAFHPGANGVLTPVAQRLAFVGASSGQIEIVDVAYYVNRGRLQLKNTIYGPLRASGPMPGDPASVVMKLYALSPQGLVVIDLTAADIKAGVP